MRIPTSSACAPLSEQDREHYGTGVRAYWKSVEDALVEEYPTVLAEAAKLYEEDPAKAAEYLRDRLHRVGEAGKGAGRL